MHVLNVIAQMAMVFFAALGFGGAALYLLRVCARGRIRAAVRTYRIYSNGARKDPVFAEMLREQLELMELLDTRPPRIRIKLIVLDEDGRDI